MNVARRTKFPERGPFRKAARSNCFAASWIVDEATIVNHLKAIGVIGW
jgi:hypothetical protein